jgi:hypothetical protein
VFAAAVAATSTLAFTAVCIARKSSPPLVATALLIGPSLATVTPLVLDFVSASVHCRLQLHLPEARL